MIGKTCYKNHHCPIHVMKQIKWKSKVSRKETMSSFLIRATTIALIPNEGPEKAKFQLGNGYYFAKRLND